MSNELFQGIKPCNSCKHYERKNNEHHCKIKDDLTERARAYDDHCHTPKGESNDK